MAQRISFKYMNHRGEISQRTVDAETVEFLFTPGYGYQPGWFISGQVEGKGRRSFALSRMMFDDALYEDKCVMFTLVRF